MLTSTRSLDQPLTIVFDLCVLFFFRGSNSTFLSLRYPLFFSELCPCLLPKTTTNAFVCLVTPRAFPHAVVALFNAISKRQNQGDGGGTGGGTGGAAAGTSKASAAKGASRHAFLDMLKTGVKPTGEAGTAAATGGKRTGVSAAGGARTGAGAGRDGGAEVCTPPAFLWDTAVVEAEVFLLRIQICFGVWTPIVTHFVGRKCLI